MPQHFRIGSVWERRCHLHCSPLSLAVSQGESWDFLSSCLSSACMCHLNTVYIELIWNAVIPQDSHSSRWSAVCLHLTSLAFCVCGIAMRLTAFMTCLFMTSFQGLGKRDGYLSPCSSPLKISPGKSGHTYRIIARSGRLCSLWVGTDKTSVKDPDGLFSGETGR